MAKVIDRYKEAFKRALSRLIADCEFRKQNIEEEIRDYINAGLDWRRFAFPYFANPLFTGY